MVPGTAEKVRSLGEAAAWRTRQTGLVVFTNGVFDLIHPGHIALLETARAQGDALIVAVNSDASARRLKGPERAIIRAGDRARVLAAFAAVDCVVIFEEDTPLDLVRVLEPDVLVKGAHYTRENTVGADIVEARGGRVMHVDIEAGHSTTEIVRRIRAPS
jgi:D-glycero-beta-D-manno-heptose 1-phosphate adenylyltransferase